MLEAGDHEGVEIGFREEGEEIQRAEGLVWEPCEQAKQEGARESIQLRQAKVFWGSVHGDDNGLCDFMHTNNLQRL